MNILLSVQSAQSERPGAYRTDITINSAQDITKFLFVKERIVRPTGEIDDSFAAVASPAEVEELPESAPESPSKYFRDNTVSLVSSDISELHSVVSSILAELGRTVKQWSDLQTFTSSITYSITPTGTTVVS